MVEVWRMDSIAFGLSRDPFERSPELDDACLPNTIATLLSELQSGLRAPQGVSALVGGSGSGKSVAAAAFARRLSAVAQTVLISRPTSSASSIARDALALLDSSDLDFTIDDDFVDALRSNIVRRARNGRTTVLIIDDAHRLSPQALEDLAGLFYEDAPLRLHIFLFGRPRLLDRLHAGAEKALRAHLLQVCRVEPLGVRESVRYLERRLAISGGDLAGLFTDEAIDEVVQRSEGRIIALELVAAQALARAARRGSNRVGAEDVRAIAPQALAEEDEIMAKHQQPLRFDIPGDDEQENDEWGARDAEDSDVQWGDDLEDDVEEEDQWHAEDAADAEIEEEPALDWDNPPHRLGTEDQGDDEDDTEFVAAIVAAKPDGQRRLVGRAVLSLAACFVLVWAANHLPGPASDSAHGRDATLFAGKLSSKPEQIMRLATTVEDADADAQVVVWREQPSRTRSLHEVRAEQRRQREQVADAKAGDGAKHSQAKPATAVADATSAAMGPAAPDGTAPAAPAERAVDASVSAARATRSETSEVVASARPAPKSPASASSPKPSAKKPAAAAKGNQEAVYTVQLGAFKTRSNAEEMASRLRGKSPRILREGGLYRVMSGSFDSKREAAVHEASLKRAGYTTYVRTAVF